MACALRRYGVTDSGNSRYGVTDSGNTQLNPFCLSQRKLVFTNENKPRTPTRRKTTPSPLGGGYHQGNRSSRHADPLW
ncbi:MAG: hypothetical protein P8X74_22880 [Reinekea sp.]